MRTNTKNSTLNPDSAVAAVLATDTLNTKDDPVVAAGAAASATPEVSAIVPLKFFLGNKLYIY